MLSQLAEKEKLSVNAEKYLYLTWLGLTPSEMRSAYYNSVMRTVEWNDRVIFVKDDKMAERLAQNSGGPLGEKELSSAEAELNSAGISPKLVYKMGFFNMRWEQAELNQPEDIVRIKEMSRHIGCNTAELEKEFENYRKARSSQ